MRSAIFLLKNSGKQRVTKNSVGDRWC